MSESYVTISAPVGGRCVCPVGTTFFYASRCTNTVVGRRKECYIQSVTPDSRWTVIVVSRPNPGLCHTNLPLFSSPLWPEDSTRSGRGHTLITSMRNQFYPHDLSSGVVVVRQGRSNPIVNRSLLARWYVLVPRSSFS